MSHRHAIDTAALDALRERVRREVDAGRMPAAQLAIGLDGEVVHTECFGTATESTRFNVFSATKAVTAAAVWQLVGEGSLSDTTRVRDVVPAFAAAGDMTLAHLLTHTGGFPYAPMGPGRWSTREGRLEQFRRWRLDWEPGERFEYHPTSAHWVAAEMIEAVEGRPYLEVIRDRVIDPLGIDFSLGEPPSAQGDVAEMEPVGTDPTPEEVRAVFGVDEVDRGEVTTEALVAFNDPAVRAVGVPGGGGIASAAGLADLYQALLHNRGGIFDPAVLADATGRIRCTLPDPMLGHAANRSLGLVIAGDDGRSAMRGMGHRVSPLAFGHNGACGQIAWADPATGMSFGFTTSAVERNYIHEARRIVAIASRAAEVIPRT
jgi:CubicO group peptidase (beta-lactamase class C family)